MFSHETEVELLCVTPPASPQASTRGRRRRRGSTSAGSGTERSRTKLAGSGKGRRGGRWHGNIPGGRGERARLAEGLDALATASIPAGRWTRLSFRHSDSAVESRFGAGVVREYSRSPVNVDVDHENRPEGSEFLRRLGDGNGCGPTERRSRGGWRSVRRLIPGGGWWGRCWGPVSRVPIRAQDLA